MPVRRPTFLLITFALVAVVLFVLRLFVGVDFTLTPPRDVLNVRLLSASVAFVVGLALAVSGVFLQTLLRNDLASPYILGISSGASLGVGLSQVLWRRISASPSPWWIDYAASAAGSFLILLLVYLLSRRRGRIDPRSLLLVGVMIGAVCTALLMFLEHVSPARDNDRLIRWMMGAISQLTPWSAVLLVTIVTLCSLALGLLNASALDVACLSEDEARAAGAPLDRIRLMLFLLSGLLAAGAVAIAGPIGFVGLIAPHLGRSFVGASHAPLILSSALLGASLLLLADLGTQVLPRATYGLLPVGVLTNVVGGLLFIWLLHRRASRSDLAP